MNEIFDLIVIGGGPAGCFTALNSAEKKLKTVLLEENSIIGEPVHCGECLSGMAAGRLGLELPEKIISKKVNGVKIIFPNKKSSFIKEEGFVLKKNKFEQWIAEKAEKKGAKIELNCKAEEIKRKNKLWEIKCSNGKIFNGKMLVDASGVFSFASRKLKLNSMPETVVGMQYRLKEIPETDYLNFYLWPELSSEGYLWMIPKENSKANVGLVTKEKQKAKTYLDEFIKRKKWENKKKEKSFGGLIPVSGPHKNTVAEGLILVGDAAGFASPLFEGGTSLALTSGKFASKITAKAVKENNFSKEFLEEYNKLWKNEFPDYNKIIKGKKALYALNEDELNYFAEVLPEDLTKISLIKRIEIGLKIWFVKPQLMWKGISHVARAFSYSTAKHYGW